MQREATDETRPEQVFFDDPAIDRAFGVVMALATEVYVLRDRLRTVERLLDEKGVLSRGEVDREPTPEAVQADAADRQAFVAGLMQPLLGRQVSKGAAYAPWTIAASSPARPFSWKPRNTGPPPSTRHSGPTRAVAPGRRGRRRGRSTRCAG